MRPMGGGQPQGMFNYYAQPRQVVTAPPLATPQMQAAPAQQWQQDQGYSGPTYAQAKQNWGIGGSQVAPAPASIVPTGGAHEAAALAPMGGDSVGGAASAAPMAAMSMGGDSAGGAEGMGALLGA